MASNVALADRAGFVGFVPAPRRHTGLHRLGAPGDPAPARVWAERGDVAVRLADGERIALLEVDVEGSELAVLRGFQALLEAGRIERLVSEISDGFRRASGSSAADRDRRSRPLPEGRPRSPDRE